MTEPFRLRTGVKLFLKDDKAERRRRGKIKTSGGARKADGKWIAKTVVITFALSVTFSAISSGVMQDVNIWAAAVILLCIIAIGILFDMIGVAVTTAEETPFHSMAAHKVRGARQAIALIGAKDKVANFCNDVIGDICGIVSGSASAAVAAYVMLFVPGRYSFFIALGITGAVAALTVGGKAMGKTAAMSNANRIVYTVAEVLAFFRLLEKRKIKS